MKYDKINRRISKINSNLESERRKNIALEKECEKIKSILSNTMHEIRVLTTQLSSKTAYISKNLEESNLKSDAETALHTTEMISARLAYTDLQLNPAAITQQPTLPSGLYKKFEKSRYVLNNAARSKNIEINFTGISFGTIEALQAFELIPFILLDNAIKYSPINQTIQVDFHESPSEIIALISSLGPTLEEGEIQKVFEEKFRGKNASKLAVYGSGLGLHIASSVARLHPGIHLSAQGETAIKFELNNIPYSVFSIKIQAKK